MCRFCFGRINLTQKMKLPPKKIVIPVVTIIFIGVLAGLVLALKQPAYPDEQPEKTNTSNSDPVNSFGGYFNVFLIGRPGTTSKISRDTPLIRATKYFIGERVGLRVQTAEHITKAFDIEVRFLDGTTSEETAALKKYRQRFNIKPGLRSYCCLTMPKEEGLVSVNIIMKNAFIGSLGTVTLIPAPQTKQKGLFGL